MKYIHEQTQPLATDSIVANSMNIYNVISIYMVTVTIMPDATAYRGTTILAISHRSHEYHIYYYHGYNTVSYKQGDVWFCTLKRKRDRTVNIILSYDYNSELIIHYHILTITCN